MNRGGIVHGRLLDDLAEDFYPSLVTIKQDAGTTQTASGQPIEDLEDLSGHVDIPCAVGPSAVGAGRAREFRRPHDTVAKSTHRIGLNGHYPLITAPMKAVVDGVTHNILGVEHDSQGASTYLETEIVQ